MHTNKLSCNASELGGGGLDGLCDVSSMFRKRTVSPDF